jgi:hypothetical protein
MATGRTGISNRETADEEQAERDVLARDDNAARDSAGHVGTETPAERLQREEDRHLQAPVAESKRGRGIRQSTNGG